MTQYVIHNSHYYHTQQDYQTRLYSIYQLNKRNNNGAVTEGVNSMTG